MNRFFENTPIWKLIILYLVANLLNYVIVFGLTSEFQFNRAISEELVRGLLFTIIIVWFIYAFIRAKVSISPEITKFKQDFNIKENSMVIIFNYAISVAMVLCLLLAITKLLPEHVLKSLTQGVSESTDFISALIGLITASILAPIAEELIFRGVLFTRMKNRYGVVIAIVLSSVLFGLTHMSLAMIRSAIFGACMCIIFLKTKNILVPIVIHMIYNFLLTIIGSYGALFGINKTVETSFTFNSTTTIIQIILCVIVVIISGLYLAKKHNFFDLKRYQTQN